MTDRTPLVGREAELDRLDAVLDGPGGPPGVVDLTGAAGIGKSRLLTEVCGRAGERGLTVLRGRATEYERHIPFRVFADAFADLDPELLRGLGAADAWAAWAAGAGDAGAGDAGAGDAGAGDAGAGDAGAGDAGAGAGPAGPADPAYPVGPAGPVAASADRFAAHRATARLLTALGGRTGAGLLIALDDLHWADPASLELLDHLVRHPLHAPVVIVAARRDRQTSPSLSAALTRGVDTGAVLRLDLGPLTERACVERLAPGLPPRRAARLYAASEGNPLYFLTLVQGQSGPALPPGGLDALLLDELTPLSAAERRTAEAVAVLGDQATPPLLLALTEPAPETAPESGPEAGPGAGPCGPERLEADLGALARRDLIRPLPGGGWSLRHPVLRAVVYENTGPGQRVALHRRAAAALAEAGAPATVRAHHVERALTGWEPEPAAVLLEAAGQSETTAPASCAHWLEVVLRVLPDAPGHAARRRDLMLKRARALSVCGELRASRDLLHEVIAGLPADGDSGVRAAAVTLCASMERHLGQYRASAALLRRELSRRPAPAPADAVALGLELGSSAPHAAPYPAVRADVLRTFELARALGNEPAAAGALAVSALGEAYEGNTAAARELTDRAAACVDALADRDLADQCEPLARLGWAEFYLERYEDAERHADRGLAIARRGGPLHLLPHLLMCKAIVHTHACRLPSALELVDEAESIARGIGSDELLGLVLANKAQVLIAARPPGDVGALAVAEEAVAAAGARTSWWTSLVWCVMSFAALHGGDPLRARSAMLRAGGPDLAGLQPSMRPLFLEALVTAAVTTGDLAEAEEWAALAGRDAERLGLPVQRAAALRCAGQVLAGAGRPAAAAERFARAADEAGRSGAALWEAQSLLIGASLTAEAGDSATAATMWRRGRRLAETGGALLLTGLADLLLPPAPPPRVPGLTPREHEIAALVAEGLTTPAIAARLYLSPRTVDTHLSHIFRKTGVTTRSALAALTARHLP
ncbi:LuxR family transcriptional regulator [Streptomyces sp. NBC_01565]|uniref:helix-turn-helix transcriptional regulator n=1 Tax=unclassified Streptomyces TaxID=2593676 RepID=UPI00224D079D|nr:LuxR family transcriptional regulator [Streptomyces sp. NBC_01565]MCX4544159.1 AAA family ATPase [Streptomyces sp. NBC_01565]